jgi:hypothetical protein
LAERAESGVPGQGLSLSASDEAKSIVIRQTSVRVEKLITFMEDLLAAFAKLYATSMNTVVIKADARLEFDWTMVLTDGLRQLATQATTGAGLRAKFDAVTQEEVQSRLPCN